VTVARWLETRSPAPPELLAQRLRSALGERLSQDAADASDACLAAAEALVAELLADVSDGGKRDCALDLLAADALVTYALEAASERPDEIPHRAARAMARISELAAGCKRAD
jgi:hypothetical protein